MSTQPDFTTRPEIRGHFGAVATTHWLATGVAMSVLERGGNAFDAAVAAGFTLQVAEPHLNGPGGEMPALFYAASEGRVRVLSAQGTAPAGATIDTFRNLGLDLIPGSGLLPAVVPGAFDGWLMMLRDYGTMKLGDVLGYAIDYAENGVPVLPKMAVFMARVEDLFKTEWPTSAAVFLPNGQAPKAGEWFCNPALAATYRRILAEAEAAPGGREAQIAAARQAWYQGWVAEAVDRFYGGDPILDASGRAHRGLMTGQDIANWSAHYEDPVSTEFGQYTVQKCGFWSQGPVMLQQLGLLREMDLASMAPDGPDFVHTYVEATKLAFADREAWYGDPDFTDVPAETLLSEAYAAERRALIGATASMELQPGSPDGRTPDIRAALAPDGDTGPIGHYWALGEPTVSADGTSRGDTVHLDVTDRWGNMVAATPSGGWLQSAPVVPELGFCMSVRAQMFWLDEGAAASLAPGKRPRTTLSPSMALRDGQPYLAWGTPGGDQQDQWSTWFFLQHVVHHRNLQAAIDAPSLHSDHAPSSFWPRGRHPGQLAIESRFPQSTLDELERRGHKLVVGAPWSEGRLSAVARSGKILKAGSNARGMQGYAAGR